jgi:hypothetical protein
MRPLAKVQANDGLDPGPHRLGARETPAAWPECAPKTMRPHMPHRQIAPLRYPAGGARLRRTVHAAHFTRSITTPFHHRGTFRFTHRAGVEYRNGGKWILFGSDELEFAR